MPQSTILTSNTTLATSTVVDIQAGNSITVGLFASADIEKTSRALVYCKTPGNDTYLGALTATSPTLQLSGPIQVVVTRPAQTQAIGVFLNT